MRRFLLGAVVAAAFLAMPAGPALGHHTTISCTDRATSTWTIVNSEPIPMTYTTNRGHTGSIGPSGAVSVVYPGTSLTVFGVWSNGQTNTSTGQGNCIPTTTTTEVTTSTTIPTSTSTPTTTSTTSTSLPPVTSSSSSTTSSTTMAATSTSGPTTSTASTTIAPTASSSTAIAPPSTSSAPTTGSSSTVASIGEPPIPPPSVEVQPVPSIEGTLPATGMGPSGWGAVWVAVVAFSAGAGLLLMARRGAFK